MCIKHRNIFILYFLKKYFVERFYRILSLDSEEFFYITWEKTEMYSIFMEDFPCIIVTDIEILRMYTSPMSYMHPKKYQVFL